MQKKILQDYKKLVSRKNIKKNVDTETNSNICVFPRLLIIYDSREFLSIKLEIWSYVKYKHNSINIS